MRLSLVLKKGVETRDVEINEKSLEKRMREAERKFVRSRTEYKPLPISSGERFRTYCRTVKRRVLLIVLLICL